MSPVERQHAADRHARAPRHPRFHFVGGKGGVGKTTCAAAFGLAAARAGDRVLVASTDPAPSLGDALRVDLSGSPRRVPLRNASLWAVEIDAPGSLRKWLADRRPLLETIAVEGTWLDREDVARLLRLSLPGIDELAGLLEIARLAASSRFDLVVVDTAPTGHTLRMLAMPETLFAVAGVFDRMREKQRVVSEALRGGWEEAAEDRLVAGLAGTARDLHAMLRDGGRTHTSWVTLAEPMAVAETSDALASLRAAGIPVPVIVVNRLTPPPSTPCTRCSAREAFEAGALRSLPPAEKILRVASRDSEPRGVRALSAIATRLQDVPVVARKRPARVRPWRAPLGGPRIDAAGLISAEHRLVLLGGKGGVGKTTCAAALALSAAAASPRRRVLLMSTDPAHSLGDVFGAPAGDEPVQVSGGPGNLRVRELDAARVLRLLQAQYVAAIDRVFDRMRGRSAFDAAHDRSVMRSLIDLAPPGLDELAAILETTDALATASAEWDLVIMDTAPTGHALRLLEMPALVHDWTKALMTILLKYQGLAPLGEFGALLVSLSRGVRLLRTLLQDAERSAFVLVTRPAALPRLETIRLAQQLTRLRIRVPAVIVNAVGRGECGGCQREARAERKELAAIRQALSTVLQSRLVVTAPAWVPPPAGVPSLERWSLEWRQAAAGRA